MGHTHFFKQTTVVPPDIWALIIKDAKILCDKSPVPLAGGVGEPGTVPEFDAESIWLNGKGEDSFETFYLPRADPKFNFCKTAHRLYDMIVVAILCAVEGRAPRHYDISSDGRAPDWEAGLQYARETLGWPELKLPPGLED